MSGSERPGARARTPESAERLVRSLVGVASATVTADPGGAIVSVAVTPAPGAAPRQVVQNVTSALLAGLGIALPPGRIVVNGQAAPAQPAAAAAPPPEAAGPAEDGDLRVLPGPGARGIEEAGASEPAGADARPVPDTSRTGALPRLHRPGPGGPAAPPRPAAFKQAKIRTHGRAVALAAVDDPMPDIVRTPSLDSIELERADARLRCRVVIAVGGERFTGIAEALDLPGAALDLPARTTAEALRTARAAPPIQYEGAAIAEVRGQLHVVAALRMWTGDDFEPVAGAAAVTASVEEAAARAVLQAVNARS